MMTYSDAGFALTKQFEGCKLEAYQDSTGRWTIGYGHALDVQPGQKISQEQAERLLRLDVGSVEVWVNKLVKVPLTQGQFDACVDFAYNEGPANFRNSSLLRFLNMNQYVLAADEFSRWVFAGGKKLQGLVDRRAAERALFLK